MAKVDFIDRIKIFVKAGCGGAGARHFRRERFVPKGGPDGGDGGRGGHVILEGNRHVKTLLDFRYRKHVIARHGMPGGKQQRNGASGQDLVLPVPLGTVIKKEDETIRSDITKHGQRCIIAYGGRGGFGNAHFKTPTNQTPKYAQPGGKGEQYTLILELKLLADVGLVGAPNAGKSTLLATISTAKPRIASYPFTTLVPNLGIVKYEEKKSFVVADIPGLIAGAAEGRGLGLRFLRHIERTTVLLFMVPADLCNIEKAYHVLQQELKKYNPALLHKASALVITKVDLLDKEKLKELQKELAALRPLFVSSLKKEGLSALKRHIWMLLNEQAAS